MKKHCYATVITLIQLTEACAVTILYLKLKNIRTLYFKQPAIQIMPVACKRITNFS